MVRQLRLACEQADRLALKFLGGIAAAFLEGCAAYATAMHAHAAHIHSDRTSAPHPAMETPDENASDWVERMRRAAADHPAHDSRTHVKRLNSVR